MRVVLRNVSWVWSGWEGERLRERCHVAVRDGCIEAIQEHSIAGPADETIDLDGCLLVPGLVSLHHHFFQHVTRAWPGAHCAPSEEWLYRLYPVWARMGTADIAAAARGAAAELLLSGTTTCADHAFLLGDEGDERLAAQVAAAAELGLRMHLVRGGLPGLGRRLEERLAALGDGSLQALLDDEEALLAQCEADLRRWHNPAPESLLRLDLGPSNVPYDKPALMRGLAELAERHRCGLHAHYHPRPAERELCLRLQRQTPLDFLDAAGWLRRGTWLAHCTELDDEEIARFAARQVGIAHCPRTVLRLGYRIPRLYAWCQAGVPVGIGADGAASNDGGAFLADVRLALLLHRAGNADSRQWLSPEEVLAMATRRAAELLGRPDLGRIAPGSRADLAAFDLSGLDCAGALNDPVAGFLLAGTQTRAHMTMVEGRVCVKDGRLVTGDEARIAREANQRAHALAG